MKFTVLSLLLFLVAFKSYAQPNVLGKNEVEAKEIIARLEDTRFIGASAISKDQQLLSYFVLDGNKVFTFFLFFKNDKCFLYQIKYPIIELNDVVKKLNHDNIPVKQTEWASKDFGYRIDLILGKETSKDAAFFYINYQTNY